MLTRTTTRRPNLQNARISELLYFIGLPRKVAYCTNAFRPSRGEGNRCFWRRYESHLPIMLREARTYFIKAMKENHPDKTMRPKRDAADLTTAWHRIKKLFALHGAMLE